MRSLISLLIAVVALTTSVEAEMLRLLVFKAPRCGPCLQFDQDYSQDASFRNALKMFECVPAFTSAKPEHNATFERYGISIVPTFVVTLPDGTEVGRVNGYKGKQDLMAGLIKVGQRSRSMPRQEPNRPARPAPQPHPQPQQDRSAEQIESLKSQNRGLSEKVYRLEEEVIQEKKITYRIRQQLEVELDRLRQRADVSPEKVAALQNRILELQRQLRSTDTLEVRDAPTPIAPVESTQGPRQGLLRSVFRHGVAIALDAGLSTAQAEVLVPVAVGAGPIGIGVMAGLWLWKRWRKRRGRSRTRGDPQTFIVDAPQAPTNHSIETQFVNVESDNYQRAHQQARQHIARRYPGSQEILDAELNLTQQFFAGRRPGE